MTPEAAPAQPPRRPIEIGSVVVTRTKRTGKVVEILGPVAQVELFNIQGVRPTPYRLADLEPWPEIQRWAEFDPSNVQWRYQLGRRFAPGPTVLFIGLNPSIADARQDDPTVRKAVGFARRWKYGTVLVGNLFAYRATDPDAMVMAKRRGDDIVGPGNDAALTEMVDAAELVVCAWSGHRFARDRSRELYGRVLQPHRPKLKMLRAGVDGAPWHPLYCPYSEEPVPFEPYWAVRVSGQGA